MNGMRHWARTVFANGLVRTGIVVMTMFAAMTATISAPPPIPAVELSSGPLFARGARSKPTLTLALSVEFPTVGAQYTTINGADDTSYSPATKYVGYFDTESCYVYNDAPLNGEPKRFDLLTAPAVNRSCVNAFSGNFMNWATSSAIDILRYGLTGGDRVWDSTSLTVLQRAVLLTSFYNSSNFPAKQLPAALAAGAVPTALIGAYTGTIYIANCLNQIYFGTAKGGSCNNAGDNGNLGTPNGTNLPTNGIYNGPLPASFGLAFASEVNPGPGPSYTVVGTQQIVYGSNNTWAVITKTGASVACSNSSWAGYGVPGLAASGDPTPGVAKKCYWRTPPTAVTSLTSDNFFYSRVSVCQSDPSKKLLDPRTELCARYPGSGYKPVGNLQKYSDLVRVATFGYLNDNTGNPSERYGGVLRSPMKYTGAKYFDSSFNLMSGTNPGQEWDPETGIFVANPDLVAANSTVTGDGSTPPKTTISGTINYLNQFGRTGTPGQYKTYDPVGELYYEALRYVQGLPPTPAATAGMTDVMKDGFPVYTAWTDPHPPVDGMTDYSCVKNNIVAIGDVNTHNDKTIPGNKRTNNDSDRAANEAGNEPDFVFWTKVVGGFESNNVVKYPDGDGVQRDSANYSANAPYNSARWGMEAQSIGADAASYYMAGMAYWANTHDIRGTQWSDESKRRQGMRLTTYVLDVNEYGAQNNPNTRRYANQFFQAAKYGGFKDETRTGNPYKQYAPNSTTIVDGNDSWNRGAADPLEARNYFLSSSAEGVLDALNSIFSNIAKEARSIAGGSVSTSTLNVGDSGYVYQAQFNPSEWSGDVVPYKITLTSTGVVEIDADISKAPWTAAAKLDALAAKDVLSSYDNTKRNIFIGNPDAPSSATAFAFSWASMNDTLRTYLSYAPGSSTSPTPTVGSEADGQARIAYLRGDRSRETSTMRKRLHVLGDVINSGVAFVGAAPKTNTDAGYSTHVGATSSRVKALYVGANDGMLHAFNAADGEELFAYIPSWVAPRLTDLTAPAYLHASYVDATPVITEAKVGSSWKTVLVGGTGAGGQGVYGLDVTDPTKFDATKVLWEFSDKNDTGIGNVIGKTQILKFRTTAKNVLPAEYRYFAVVPGGVNNYVDDGRVDASGDAYLFLLDIAKPAGTSWQLDTNYFRVKLPKSVTTLAQGVINFSAKVGLADEVQQIYAGDLQGNMWKLNFADFAVGSKWSSLADLSPYGTSPMFVATDGSRRQPISSGPALIYGTQYKLIVAFGTGKYLELSDLTKPYSTQSTYAILDDGTTTALGDARNLLQRIDASATATTGPTFRWGRPTSSADTSVRAGWYFDLPSSGSGERQISSFVVSDSMLIGATIIPSVNTCDPGTGNIYAIDVFTGGGAITASTVGMPSEPTLMNIGETPPQASDSTGVRRVVRTSKTIVTGSGGIAPAASPPKEVRFGRLSWRLINLNK